MEDKWITAKQAAKLANYKDVGSVGRIAQRYKVETKPNPDNKAHNLYHKQDFLRALVERKDKHITTECLPYIPPKYNTFWSLTGDFILISDVHCPFIDWDFFYNGVLAIRDRWKIDRLLVAGDTLNCDAFSKFYSIVETSWQQEKVSARKFLTVCSQEFDEVYILTANHELRLLKKLWLSQTPDVLVAGDRMELWELLMGKMEDATKGRLRFSIYPYCVINDSATYGWRIVHPNQYRKQPLSFGREQAAKYFQNIVVTHAHMSAWSYAPNSDVQLFDMGVFANPLCFPYKQMQVTAHYDWSESFMVIKDNVGTIFRRKENGKALATVE